MIDRSRWSTVPINFYSPSENTFNQRESPFSSSGMLTVIVVSWRGKKKKKKEKKKKKKTTRTMGTCSNSDLFPMIIPRSFTRIHASPRYETRGRKAYKLITFSSTFISNSFEQETFGQIENFFSLLLFIPAFLHIISKRSERKRVSQHCVNDFLKFFEF